MSRIVIREATEQDLDPVTRLYRELGPARVSTDAVGRLWRRLALYPDYRMYVAEEEDGGIRGTFLLLIMDTIGVRCRPEAIVEDVVVSRSARREGVGRAMMEFARETAVAKGCYKLVLSSNLAREEAHLFYESLGFERHGYSFLLDLEAQT